VIDLLRERLIERLDAVSVDIDDESAAHAGHAGNQGGGHFQVRIVSLRFANLPRIARHRLVYDAVADLMQGKIHALGIVAQTPGELGAQTHESPIG
jgi:BolA family transcriptional regulator, general stress-responsive regulator